MRCRTFVLATLALSASTATAQAQKGTWDGAVYMQQGSQKLTVVLDSAAAGWTGAAVSAQAPDSLKLVEVKVKADTLSFGVPYNGMVIYFVGLVADGKFNGNMWVNNANAGSVELVRKSEAAKKP